MSTTEPIDNEHENEAQGWDAFWDETLRAEAAERGQAPTEVIRGIEVRVPQDMPLKFEQKAKRLKDSGDDAAFAELLAELFGADVLDAWRDNGMGAREFRVVLAWGMSHGRGKPISFREAYDAVMSNDKDPDEGKAESSTRASGGSGGSGRSSKPTSAASTASGRRTSRR